MTDLLPSKETCIKAMLSRDPSYDGCFFVGVKTTGVYCRNVCKVRMPKPKNVEFFPTTAAAEASGFRPCLRCRPETAPFSPAWNGTQSTVTRATRLIEQGMLRTFNCTELAENLGITTRHLNRLFTKNLGKSVSQYWLDLKMERALQLITKTDLSMKEVASRAGFKSVRRFNGAILAEFGSTPTGLRNRSQPPSSKK